MDASQYKDYVLVLLFIKYVSDKYAGQPYAPITIPPGASFKDMVALKGKSDIGDQINKKITAMGDDAPCEPGPVPPVPLNDARAIFKTILAIEEESVSLWSELFHQTDDDVALNGMAQTYATECRGHADDLRRYLRSCE